MVARGGGKQGYERGTPVDPANNYNNHTFGSDFGSDTPNAVAGTGETGIGMGGSNNSDGWSSPGGGYPLSGIPATMPIVLQGGAPQQPHTGESYHDEQVQPGFVPPRGSKSAHARMKNAPAPHAPMSGTRRAGGGVGAKRSLSKPGNSNSVNSSSSPSVSPQRRTVNPNPPPQRTSGSSPTNAKSLSITFKEASKDLPSHTAHPHPMQVEADAELAAELENQKVHFEGSMHELKSDIGAALDGMQYEFKSIRNELEVTRAMAATTTLDKTVDRPIVRGGQGHQDPYDISSQINSMQSRLMKFEVQLEMEKEEKRVLSDQLAEMKLKEMAVKTGISLKYDNERAGVLASPMGTTGFGASAAGADVPMVVAASASVAESILASKDSKEKSQGKGSEKPKSKKEKLVESTKNKASKKKEADPGKGTSTSTSAGFFSSMKSMFSSSKPASTPRELVKEKEKEKRRRRRRKPLPLFLHNPQLTTLLHQLPCSCPCLYPFSCSYCESRVLRGHSRGGDLSPGQRGCALLDHICRTWRSGCPRVHRVNGYYYQCSHGQV